MIVLLEIRVLTLAELRLVGKGLVLFEPLSKHR